MSIGCTAECFHFRILFKICLQVRHLVQILAEVQEITFSAPFVYITDIHEAAGQKIRKLVTCYHQSQLCFPVSFIEIAVQTDSKAFCILFNICQLCPVIQAGGFRTRYRYGNLFVRDRISGFIYRNIPIFFCLHNDIGASSKSSHHTCCQQKCHCLSRSFLHNHIRSPFLFLLNIPYQV